MKHAPIICPLKKCDAAGSIVDVLVDERLNLERLYFTSS